MSHILIPICIWLLLLTFLGLAIGPAPKCVEQKRGPDGVMQCVLREGELPCDTWILVKEKWECKP